MSQAVAYDSTGKVVAEQSRNTTGVPAALSISVKDGVGLSLTAGCADVAFVQVEVVDSMGAVVPTADNMVTFEAAGAAVVAGTANGDPACLVNNKSPTRPAFNGLVMAVLLTGDDAGLVKVVASSPGLPSVSLTLTVQPQSAGAVPVWCNNGPRL